MTRLLQDSLGGNTRTILIACVAPTALHVSETLSTLSFADRAKNVMVKVKANIVVDDKALLARAQAEILRLKQLLKQALERTGTGTGGGSDRTDGVDDDDYHPHLDQIQSNTSGNNGNSGTGSVSDSHMQSILSDNAKLKRENEELQQKLYIQSIGAGGGGGRSNGHSGHSSNNGSTSGKKHKKKGKQHQQQQQHQQLYRSSNSGGNGSSLPNIQRPGLPPQNMKESGYGYYAPNSNSNNSNNNSSGGTGVGGTGREKQRSNSYGNNTTNTNTNGIARMSSPIHIPKDSAEEEREDTDTIAINKLRAKLAK